MFVCFKQQMVGGKIIVDEHVADYVIIEAPSVILANTIAPHVGIYFFGSEVGRDCPCCGDRWKLARGIDAFDTPKIYGEPASEFKAWKDVTIHVYDKDLKKTVIKRPADRLPLTA